MSGKSSQVKSCHRRTVLLLHIPHLQPCTGKRIYVGYTMERAPPIRARELPRARPRDTRTSPREANIRRDCGLRCVGWDGWDLRGEEGEEEEEEEEDAKLSNCQRRGDLIVIVIVMVQYSRPFYLHCHSILFSCIVWTVRHSSTRLAISPSASISSTSHRLARL